MYGSKSQEVGCTDIISLWSQRNETDGDHDGRKEIDMVKYPLMNKDLNLLCTNANSLSAPSLPSVLHVYNEQ